MTEHTYRIICDCNEEILNEIIHQWWEETTYSKKELIEDLLPKRFYGTFRIGHYRGESKIRFIFGIKGKDPKTIFKISILFPDWSPIYPHNTLQDIICWFVSSLRKRNIKTEFKQKIFSKKIICP